MLITTRLSFLQQIQKAAISGYHFYTSGTIEIEKLPSLIRKFQTQYQTNQTRQQAYRKRQQGQASAKFYCYADETDLNGTKIFWVLLFTEGTTPAQQTEILKDLRIKKQRFEYSDYQLIQKPRTDGKQKFTFQLKTDSFNYYQEQIRKRTRNKNYHELNKLIIHLNKMPGFSAIRTQKKKLNAIHKGETKKHLKSEDQDKVQKMTNFYHRQQKLDHIKRLNVFIKQMTENNRTVKQQLRQYRQNNKARGKYQTPNAEKNENQGAKTI